MEEFICRICLESEPDNTNLIAPCMCNGSSKYVHRNCLENWRNSGQHRDASRKCVTCGYFYEFEHVLPENCDSACIRKCRKNFKRRIIKDIVVLSYYLLIVLFCVMGLAYLLDPIGVVKKLTGSYANYIYFLIGFCLLFFVLAFFHTYDNGRIRNNYHQGFSDFENVIVNGAYHMYYQSKDNLRERYNNHYTKIFGSRKRIKSRETNIPVEQNNVSMH